VFEGRFGFLRAYLDEDADPEAITRGLGEKWELARTFFKPYPANHFTHAGIDAAMELRGGGLPLGEVEALELGVAAPVLRTIAQPEGEKARPATGYAAQFSGPFTVATALVGGGGLGVSLEDFTDEDIGEEEKLRLASLVTCHADEDCTDVFPNQFPAVLRARLKGGEVREARVMHNRGGPENPLSDEELRTKFRANAGRALPEEQAAKLEEALGSLEGSANVGEVMGLVLARQPG
jgi:2-methylcitrate dehydratase PrpD